MRVICTCLQPWCQCAGRHGKGCVKPVCISVAFASWQSTGVRTAGAAPSPGSECRSSCPSSTRSGLFGRDPFKSTNHRSWAPCQKETPTKSVDASFCVSVIRGEKGTGDRHGRNSWHPSSSLIGLRIPVLVFVFSKAGGKKGFRLSTLGPGQGQAGATTGPFWSLRKLASPNEESAALA